MFQPLRKEGRWVMRRQNFLRGISWSALHHVWEVEKDICNTSRSRIANFTFSSAASTSNATIQTKFNKFKLCIWIFFNNICLTTSGNNFFWLSLAKGKKTGTRVEDIHNKPEFARKMSSILESVYLCFSNIVTLPQLIESPLLLSL